MAPLTCAGRASPAASCSPASDKPPGEATLGWGCRAGDAGSGCGVDLVRGKASRQVDVLCSFQVMQSFPCWEAEPRAYSWQGSLGALREGEGSLEKRSADLRNP